MTQETFTSPEQQPAEYWVAEAGLRPVFISNPGPGPAFLCIAGDKVRISLLDGSVTLTDIEPDEAAKAFWDAVRRNF